MKRIYEDNILLCSNRTDRRIPPHQVSGYYFVDDNGFTIFHLDQTKRDFSNRNITFIEGYFLVIGDCCYKVIAIEFAEKRPKIAICKTVSAKFSDIPFYQEINFTNRYAILIE